MIVLVEEIGSRGLALDREVSLSFLSEVLAAGPGPTGFAAAAPGRLHARFEKVSGKILLIASGQVSVKGECKRCLSAAQVEVPLAFTLSLVRRAAEPAEEGGADEGRRGGKSRKESEVPSASFDVESVEEEPFDGRSVDLGGILREQILLALPMDLLCREDCKGLCPVCGKDLNQEACGCETSGADPRWAALRGLRGR
jgi:uncharacterized protein